MVDLVPLEIQDGIAVLRLAPEGDKIPILNADRMRGLAQRLEAIAGDKSIKALIIAGNTSGFCGGADISLIQSVATPSDGEKLAKEGQRIFQVIEDLPIPSFAAISGACAGGGCELALACSHRLITGLETSKIGLPEVRLGILPGFGGTQRLPKLVGFPEAAKCILKGRLLGADEALQIGLVDQVIRGGSLEAIQAAKEMFKKGEGKKRASKLSLGTKFLSFTGPGRAIVSKKLVATVEKETGGNYPAPLKAIQAMMAGLAASGKQGYELEAKYLGELVAGSECKSLVHIFQSSEAAQRLGRARREEANQVETVVVGAGVMGSGIASVLLSRGYKVAVIDSSAQALQKSKERVEGSLQGNRRLSEAKRIELLKNIRFEPSLDKISNAGLVIEAIIEDFDGKRKLLEEIVKSVSDTAIVASNTSSISVSKLAEGLSRPERILGMHFFNPAEKMPLIEIVRAKNTDEHSLLLVSAVAAQVGKYPIIVEDGAGFLVNRLLTPYLAEAGLLLSEGFRVEDIDGAAKKFGMPMGPIRLLDEVGLDVAAHVSQIMVAAYGEDFRAPNHVEKLLKSGRKGKKTGSGFYVFQGDSEFVDASLPGLLGLPGSTKNNPADLLDRLILRMVNEAFRCLKTGVAGAPGAEAAQQIDLGTVMGCGFPPFRGGVIHYAHSRGLANVVKRLGELEKTYGTRFAASSELLEAAK